MEKKQCVVLKICMSPTQKVSFFYDAPLHWKLQLSFAHFFYIFDLTEPSNHLGILIPLVARVYFMKLHIVKYIHLL